MADELDILAAKLNPPHSRFAAAPKSRIKPEGKPPPTLQLSSNVSGARTDAELQTLLAENLDKTVVINFGSTWCHSCHAMFPHFYRLTAEFPKFKYVVAQIDYMNEATRGVHYTPTFRIVHKGRTVDQFYGASHVALRDHLWLHSDRQQ